MKDPLLAAAKVFTILFICLGLYSVFMIRYSEASDPANNHSGELRVLTIDSCEYVTHGQALCHKGNCRYCASRAKKVVVVQ